jgi:hypothetical protein
VGAVAKAQSDEDSMRSGRPLASGILLDRISHKDLGRWGAIERVVFAEDLMGFPSHPRLRSMWEQVDRSGHAVYIELYCRRRVSSNLGGAFRIEVFDPLGIRHVAVIRLYLATIDMVSVELVAARPNGFIPFQGLNREERYAEVLGHELAHAVHILSNLTRARMVEDMIEQTHEDFLSHIRQYGHANLKSEMLRRIVSRDHFLSELEEHAEAIEMMIWSELVSGRNRKRFDN